MKQIIIVIIFLFSTNQHFSEESSMIKFNQLTGVEKEKFFNTQNLELKFQFLKFFLAGKKFLSPPIYHLKFLSNGKLLFDESGDEWSSHPKGKGKINHFVGKWEIMENALIIFPDTRIGIQEFKNPDKFVDVELVYVKSRNEFILYLKRRLETNKKDSNGSSINLIEDNNPNFISPSFRTYKE